LAAQLAKQLERQRERAAKAAAKKAAAKPPSEKAKKKAVGGKAGKATGNASSSGFPVPLPLAASELESRKPPKMRNKRKMAEDASVPVMEAPSRPAYGKKAAAAALALAHAQGAMGDELNANGSIIKRRMKKSLKISIDPSVGQRGAAANTITSMAPPDSTGGRRSVRLRGGNQQLGLGALESPFGGLDSSLAAMGMDRSAMFPSADTPGNLMSLDPPLSKQMSALTSESLRFDFDEVVQHFPSPMAGGQLGSSPRRWGFAHPSSTGSVSSAVFNFPDSAKGPAKASFGDVEVDASKSVFAKKFRKAHKGGEAGDSGLTAITSAASMTDHAMDLLALSSPSPSPSAAGGFEKGFEKGIEDNLKSASSSSRPKGKVKFNVKSVGGAATVLPVTVPTTTTSSGRTSRASSKVVENAVLSAAKSSSSASSHASATSARGRGRVSAAPSPAVAVAKGKAANSPTNSAKVASKSASKAVAAASPMAAGRSTRSRK
jgi:hypothetical protein